MQPSGIVVCGASAHTTDSVNLDGNRASSSDRTQDFDNGSPIFATIGTGIAISGAGLAVSQVGGRNHAPRPIRFINDGSISASGVTESLGLHGNGGAVNYSGAGTVISGDGIGIFVHNTGPVALILDGNVQGGVPAPPQGHHKIATPPGVKVEGLGFGDIFVGGAGNVVGPGGRGIWAEQTTGMGGIRVTGTGDTAGRGIICPGVANLQYALSRGKTGCSGIRAVIDGPQNAGNILVDRSGNISGTSTAINAITFGRGDMTIVTGATAQITGVSEFGIEAAAKGTQSSGSIRVVTGANGTLTSGGNGIFAVNNASRIGKGRQSSISIDASGSINSGGFSLASRNDKNPTGVLGGISAGYVGGATATINDNVYGTLSIDDKASILATTGDGVVAYNFGRGPTSVFVKNVITSQAGDGISTTTASGLARIVVTGATITASGAGHAALVGYSASGTIEADIDQGSVLRGVNAASGIVLSGPSSTIINRGIVQGGTFSSLDHGSNLRGVGIRGSNIALDNFGTVGGGLDTATQSRAPALVFDGGVNHVSNAGHIGDVDVIGPAAFMPALVGSKVGNPLVLDGSLRFASTAAYDIRLSAGVSDSVQTSGAVRLGSARLNIETGGVAPPPGRRFTILSAAQGVGSHFGVVTSDLAFLTPAVRNNGFQVSIVTAYDFQNGAVSTNAAAVGHGLNSSMGRTTQATLLVNGLERVPAGQGEAVLSAVSGDGFAASQNAAFRAAQLFGDSIFDRLTAFEGSGGESPSVMSPAFSADASDIGGASSPRRALADEVQLAEVPLVPVVAPNRNWHVWSSAFGGAENLQGDPISGAASQNIGVYGGMIGVDHRLTPDDLFGVALGASNGHATMPDRTMYGLNTGGHFGLYDVAVVGAGYVAAASSVSSFSVRTSRVVAGFGALAGEDEVANFTSVAFSSRLEAGRSFDLRDVKVTPFLSVEVAEAHSKSFAEHSVTSLGNFALDVGGQYATSVPGHLGTRLQGDAPLGPGMELRPMIQAAYVHEFSTSRTLAASLVDLPGSTFVVGGARPARDAASMKGGAELAFGARSVLFATLDGTFSRTTRSESGRGGFLYLW